MNWLHNGEGTGDTETGAYTLLGGTATPTDEPVKRDPAAAIFLASDDEWYKAAYYDTGSHTYFDYPASTDVQIVCSAPSEAVNRANCGGAVGDLVDVRELSGLAQPERHVRPGRKRGGVDRHDRVPRDARGARWRRRQPADRLRGEIQEYDEPGFEGDGIRVAPEPRATELLIAGVLAAFGLAAGAGWANGGTRRGRAPRGRFVPTYLG